MMPKPMLKLLHYNAAADDGAEVQKLDVARGRCDSPPSDDEVCRVGAEIVPK